MIGGTLGHGVEVRFGFRAHQRGRRNTSDLIDRFGIFQTQASQAIRSETLRAINQPIEQALVVEAKYQPMSAPQPSWHWTEPYTYDRFRRHTRAFCRRDSNQSEPAATSGIRGVYRHTVVIPHPGRSEDQNKAIRIDYGMHAQGRAGQQSPKTDVLLRARLPVNRYWSIRTTTTRSQIVLLNRDQILGRQDQTEEQ